MSGGCCCAEEKSCCCSDDARFTIPTVSTQLSIKDILGAVKVRWGIGRMDYKVDPGLYAVGKPDKTSPVLVSANYKLTFDSLRKELAGIDCWIMVLDTKGVNNWCAAGKGTFGTNEIVNRIVQTGLSKIVSHKTLILPQLGAPGVSAHMVAVQSGFAVKYGPVRAKDLREFLSNGLKASQKMRTVNFTMLDRLVLTPVELVSAAKTALKVFGLLFLINLFAIRQFGLNDFIAYAGAVLVGTVATPLLLPFIPGRVFSWKGWVLGLCWTEFISWYNGWFSHDHLLLAIGYTLVLPAYSAYLAMNFTGSSTYTSFSGVMKEMKLSLPFIITFMALGIVLILINAFIG